MSSDESDNAADELASDPESGAQLCSSDRSELNGNQLYKLLLAKSPAITLVPNPGSISNVWQHFGLIQNSGHVIDRYAACRKCLKVFLIRNESGKSIGTKNLSRHTSSCAGSASALKPTSFLAKFSDAGNTSATSQVQLTLHQSMPHEVQFSGSEIAGLKYQEVKFVVLGNHSFCAVENPGLIGLCQSLVDRAAIKGKFCVKEHLFGRKSIREETLRQFSIAKNTIKKAIQQPIQDGAFSLTIDIATDSLTRRSYLDVHASWVDGSFKASAAPLAIRHFGTESHTADNIFNRSLDIFAEFGISSESTPVTTDRGANIVAAFHGSIRLDCLDHRLHTVLSTAWTKTKDNCSVTSKYEKAVSDLCAYVKCTSGVQEQLPITLKHGGDTRPWTALYSRADAICESYEQLLDVMKGRNRLYLIAAVDPELNTELRDFFKLSASTFLKLQCNIPNLQFAVPTYYLLASSCSINGRESNPLRELKKNLLKILDDKYWNSLKAWHWVACFLDPSFKDFDFIPEDSDSEKKFRKELMADVEKWTKSEMNDVHQKLNPVSADNEPNSDHTPPKRHCSQSDDPFAGMRSRVSCTIKPCTVDAEFEAYNKSLPAVIDHANKLLDYWKVNSRQYPILSLVARRIYSASASSATSERDFSSMKLTLADHRASLSPDSVEAIEIVKGAIQAGFLK